MPSCSGTKNQFKMTPIDPFQMGVKIAKLTMDEEVENVVDRLTALELWSTIISTDSLLEIIYKPANFQGSILKNDEVSFDIQSPEFNLAKETIIELVKQNNDRSNDPSIVIHEDDEDPIIVLKVNSYESVVALKNSANIETISLGGLYSDSNNDQQNNDISNNRNKKFLDGMASVSY